MPTWNWWGSATGPTIASNPGGTGEEIIDPDNLVALNNSAVVFLQGRQWAPAESLAMRAASLQS